MESPLIYVWSRHAQLRLRQRGIDPVIVEAAMRENWGGRRPNRGKAKWQIEAGGVVVNFDCPVDGNHRKVFIYTVWAG